MRLLVTGGESSGTKLVTGLLRHTDASYVEHMSPHYRLNSEQWNHYLPLIEDFDAVVLVVRHSPWRDRSAIENKHVENMQQARDQSQHALYVLTRKYSEHLPMFIVTYESIVHEWPTSFRLLVQDMGLQLVGAPPAPGNANAKYSGGVHFRDDEEAWLRGPKS